eukprot:jgi/Bigna1/75549/fgenesh1_pg.35_\
MYPLVALILALNASPASPAWILAPSIKANFTTDVNSQAFGRICWLSAADSAVNLISTSAKPAPVWKASFVIKGSKEGETVTVDSTDANARRYVVGTPSPQSIVLRWSIPIATQQQQGVNATMSVDLVDGQLHMHMTFVADSPSVALWQWSLFPANNVVSAGGANFENRGFGLVHTPPKSFSGSYPQQTMQFMAILSSNKSNNGYGVYVAAHDAKGESKNFGCNVDGTMASFQISAIPPDAGVRSFEYTHPWPVVLAVFEGSWWDAAEIYRNWAVSEADWTRQGPMHERSDIPQWLFNVTTWVNSHWQGNDIFNTTGGDPAVVLNRMRAIESRFGLRRGSLALHWYEWDTLGYKLGSNYSVCETEKTCGFDTHYPEYFPVRSGFESALREIQSLGVKVAPYINGRIFDVGTKSWASTAQAAAAKSAKAAFGAESLDYYNEQYGSEAVFAVMCPHSEYWQATVAEVTGKLAALGVDGVYIDQIAAAGPRPCWDPSHNHTLGGGSHWVSGYTRMLQRVREAVTEGRIVLTESNAEPFMSGVNLFLTLVGFDSGDLPPVQNSSSLIVPAFQAVYGGYVLPVGAEFFQQDFLPNPDVFAAKVAAQFVFGAQMGWFSLGGRDNQSPPMGTFELMMDAQYDAEMSYLRSLSNAKLAAGSWFNHGRVMRPLELEIKMGGEDVGRHEAHLRTHPRSSKLPDKAGLAFGPVMSSAWLSARNDSLLIVLTSVKRDASRVEISGKLDMARYGFGTAAMSKRFAVSPLPVETEQNGGLDDARADDDERRFTKPSPQELVGKGCSASFPGDAVEVDASLDARGIVMLRIQLCEE